MGRVNRVIFGYGLVNIFDSYNCLVFPSLTAMIARFQSDPIGVNTVRIDWLIVTLREGVNRSNIC